MQLHVNSQFSTATIRLIFVICAFGVFVYSAPVATESVLVYKPFSSYNGYDELDRYAEPDERMVDNRKREFFQLEQDVLGDENTKLKRSVFARTKFRPAKRTAFGRSGFRPAKRSAIGRSGFRPAKRFTGMNQNLAYNWI